MITTHDYFQAKPHSVYQERSARELLLRVNALTIEAERDGAFVRQACPNTGTEISGSKGGNGDGGFRLDTATTGGAHSSHKILYVQLADGSWRLDPLAAQAGVDVFDPDGQLDAWITDEILERHELYREHPDSTPGWCHLTMRAPHSGHRTFQP